MHKTPLAAFPKAAPPRNPPPKGGKTQSPEIPFPEAGRHASQNSSLKPFCFNSSYFAALNLKR